MKYKKQMGVVLNYILNRNRLIIISISSPFDKEVLIKFSHGRKVICVELEVFYQSDLKDYLDDTDRNDIEECEKMRQLHVGLESGKKKFVLPNGTVIHQ